MIQRLQSTIDGQNKIFKKLQRKLERKGIYKTFNERAKSQINNNRINNVFEDSSIDW